MPFYVADDDEDEFDAANAAALSAQNREWNRAAGLGPVDGTGWMDGSKQHGVGRAERQRADHEIDLFGDVEAGSAAPPPPPPPPRSRHEMELFGEERPDGGQEKNSHTFAQSDAEEKEFVQAAINASMAPPQGSGGAARRSKARRSKARRSKARRSKARRSKARRSKARRNKARRSKARRSKARRSKARRSKARRSKARRSKARIIF